MSYKDKLFLRLNKNLNRYFPSENLKIIKIKSISELYKNKIETKTYKCILNGIHDRAIYIKYFANHKIKKNKEIKEIKKFNKYKNKLRIPRIYDFYGDLNSIILESAEGIVLSKLFPLYLLPGLKTLFLGRIEGILKEVAQAVAFLHINTKRKKNKQILVRSFNDLKLGNILFDGRKIKIIDFEMTETDYMEDIISFIISLEMLQKFPHINQNDFISMKNLFLREYTKNINWKINYESLEERINKRKYKILQLLKNKNARRGTGFFEKIIIEWNIRYINNKLKKTSGKAG